MHGARGRPPREGRQHHTYGDDGLPLDYRRRAPAEAKRQKRLVGNLRAGFLCLFVTSLLVILFSSNLLNSAKSVRKAVQAIARRDDEQLSDSKKAPRITSRRPLDDPFWEQYHNMSFVYTWVNGSDPWFVEQRAAAGRGGGESRYRETEELVHSMRLLALFMPWHTGTIFLVTPNGVAPTWLNQSHPRVKVIDQNSLIPRHHQPAFNSAVIEQNLHRIPGLSDIFLFLNDDFMFGRPIHVSDFITDDGGVRLYHDASRMASNVRTRYREYARNGGKQIWVQSVYHTGMLLQDTYGGSPTRHFVKHAPFVYYRKVFEHMHAIWRDQLEESGKNHFRSTTDLLIPFLHNNMLKESPELAKRGFTYQDHVGLPGDLDSVLCIVKDGNDGTHKKMIEQIENPHMFFTVNDGFKWADTAELLRSFLHRIAPFPSEFEKVPVLANGRPALIKIPGVDFAHQPRPDVARWSNSFSTMSRRTNALVKGTLALAETYATPGPDAAQRVIEESYRRWLAVHWKRGQFIDPLFSYPSAKSLPLGGPDDAALTIAAVAAEFTAGHDAKRTVLPDPCGAGEAVTAACLGKAYMNAPQVAPKAPNGGDAPKKPPVKTYDIVPDCVGVDVVFTWVNGSNMEVLLDMMYYNGLEEGIEAASGQSALQLITQRVRDFGQLRFGLRSIRKYLPWVRHVWVLSGTPKPHWLDDTSPYISYVPHSTVFTDAELPQLQSSPIQGREGRIPRLADRFIAMDDDYIFLRAIQEAELLGADWKGTRALHSAKWNPKVFAKSAYRELSILTEEETRQRLERESAGAVGNGHSLARGPEAATHSVPVVDPFYINRHVPVVADLLMYEEHMAAFPEAMALTVQHKLRHPKDYEPFFGYSFYVHGRQEFFKKVPEQEKALRAYTEDGSPAYERFLTLETVRAELQKVKAAGAAGIDARVRRSTANASPLWTNTPGKTRGAFVDRAPEDQLARYMCRIAGADVATWTDREFDAVKKAIGEDCVGADAAAMFDTIPKSDVCLRRVGAATSAVALGYPRGPDGIAKFFMMKDQHGVEAARQKVKAAKTEMMACFNDDLPSPVPTPLLRAIAQMLDELQPDPASWELDVRV